MRTERPSRLYAGYVFDLDGTIYLGGELLPGVKHCIDTLRASGSRVMFLTNNPTKDVSMYADKLGGMGLEADPSEIVTTVYTTTQWILQHAPDAAVYPIAEEPLVNALQEAGIRISDDPSEIDIVIASYDRGLTWQKLQTAFEALWFHRRARLIATNPDLYCPFPGGRGEVDAGAVIAALESVTGVKCEVNCGKPSSVMLETIMTAIDLPASECIVVGDRLYTEIRMGLDAGSATAIVLTGETTPEHIASTEPASLPRFVLNRLDELLPE